MKITRTICTPSTDITVEIKLLPSEVEAAYREQEETFRLLDAERQLCEYLHFDVRDYDKGDREDAEALKSFKTEFGDIEPRSLVDESCPNYVLLQGEDPQPARELEALIEAYNGQKPDMLGKMGVCVAINAGPRIVGISFRGKDACHAVGEEQ